MRSNSDITYILLERWHEDRYLIHEILDIQANAGKLGIKSGDDFIKRFPMLTELRQKLEEELREGRDDYSRKM